MPGREPGFAFRRWISGVARGGLALTLFLLVLAVLRWGPVHAEPPWPVRALPLAGVAVALAVAAAFCGRDRPRAPVRPIVSAAAALALGLVALAAGVGLRGPAGLAGEVSGPSGLLARLPPGPVEVNGPVLRPLELPAVRRWTFRWDGPLRVPRAGAYRLWVEGRGHVRVTLDGWPVLEAEGDPLRAGRDLPLTRAEHRLEVELQRIGPGARLRLGWTRPDGRAEMIPPRFLGPGTARGAWWLTDASAVVVAAAVAVLALLIPWDARRDVSLAPAAVTRREVAASLFGHALLVAAMSWPLVTDLAGSGVMDRPDGRLNAWILAWDVHALTHGRALFDAPIFHPLPDALAFSENLLVPALIAAPALLLGGPVLGYNVVLLLSLVVSGLGAQLLARRFTGDRLAAFVGGAFFAVGPHRWTRLAHLHAQVTLFLPFALLALEAFWQRRRLREALLSGLLLGLQALSSIYLGAVTLLVMVVGVAAAGLGGLRRREWARLGLGLLLAAVLVAPFVRPYVRMRAYEGVEWTLADVATYATTLESYAASGTRLWGSVTQRHMDPDRVRDTLFPGLAALSLGVAGLATAPRRLRGVALAAVALAVVISLGPETGLYRTLHEHVLLVRGLRALSRFSLVLMLALAVLSSLALSGRPRLAAVALAAFLVESHNVPIRYARAPSPDPVLPSLAGGPGAVVVLPLGQGDTQAMLDGVPAFPTLVNGDSGFIPRPYTRAMERLEGGLSEDALRLLRALDVRYVVTRDEGVRPVPEGEAARVPAAGDACPAVWSSDAITLDLGQVREVGRVGFETSEAAWVERPRVVVSEDGVAWTAVEAVASLADATLALYRDPRHGRGELVFAPRRARYVRIDPRLPARAGPLTAGR